jgi:hypothetical protein
MYQLQCLRGSEGKKKISEAVFSLPGLNRKNTTDFSPEGSKRGCLKGKKLNRKTRPKGILWGKEKPAKATKS